jgi:phosphoribosylamine---glycine ligase
MKVLVVGGGGREHALCLALSRDPTVSALLCAPGNAGIADLAAVLPVAVDDPSAIADLASDALADLVVIGPEVPLVAGAADAVRAAGIACFGPSVRAARIEGSKAFAKEVMAAAGVPTAASRVCITREEVAVALDEFGPPYVVKDDGLAAGKGVVVTTDRAVALTHAASCQRVVIEEFLDGPELSLFAITDGLTALPLAPAQDFKRVGDGDTGPNTGGMGAYSPLPWAPKELVDEVVADVVTPTVAEMQRRGLPFAGLLYAGLALTSKGVRVVEFNARFGDPETQVVLARLRTPLAGLLWSASTGALADQPSLEWDEGAAVTVVMAAAGYPQNPRKGDLISGVDAANQLDGVQVFHAGTAHDAAGRLVTAGGRVVSVTGVGQDVRQARDRAYAAVGLIDFRGAHYRKDIAAVAVNQPGGVG